MQLGPGLPDLTYCTNIHPARGWDGVFAEIRSHVPALQARLSPGAPFGIGLRISALEAEELLAGSALPEFRDWLEQNQLYVALLNGYPYATFHGEPVKMQVFAPDWQDPRRLRYTLDLARILAGLLPEGGDGGISTIPLSARSWVDPDSEAALTAIERNLVEAAELLIRIREETGRLIHIDVEPEPGGLLENTPDAVAFFDNRLFGPGARRLALDLGLSAAHARDLLAEHIRLCFDCCHFAVAYEDPGISLAMLETCGIAIGRVQVSSALAVGLPRDRRARTLLRRRLSALDEPVYLHQVVAATESGRLLHYPDLPHALADDDTTHTEWRIHFHVPIFLERFQSFGSTQPLLRTALAECVRRTPHLEIETYTWSVLPDSRRLPLDDSIEREYRWVIENLCEKRSLSTSSA